MDAPAPADDDRRLRVLYVAFYFPPTAGGGVERTLQFLGHLPGLGIDCEVLAPDDAKWLATDPTSVARVPVDVRVHRVRYRGPGNRRLPADRLSGTSGLRRLALRARLAPRRLLVPDVDAPWLFDAVPEGLRLLREGRFDAIVTTSPPHSVALAGAILASRSGLPWIADWRDPWTTHADLSLGRRLVRAKVAAAEPLERGAIERMAAAACVNEQIVEEIHRFRPGLRTAIIPNGADLELLEELAPRQDPARLTLLFSGYFFGSRNPRVFLRALRRLVADRPELAPRLRVRFVGRFREEDRELLTGPLAGIVEVEGSRPYRDVLQAQLDAHALVLFMQAAEGRGSTFVPAKTWEYLAAERPILALVPSGGAAARILGELGDALVVAPDDEDGCRDALERLVERFDAGRIAAPRLDPATRAGLGRRGRAEAFAALIRAAVGERDRVG